MRAKQSSTAFEMYRCSGPSTQLQPMGVAASGAAHGPARSRQTILRSLLLAERGAARSNATGDAAAETEGLLHDARNLMGALGLYCDLLAVPDVLKPEHRHYAEEVRLLGSRSQAMIQRLMEQRADGSAQRANGFAQPTGAPPAPARNGAGLDADLRGRPRLRIPDEWRTGMGLARDGAGAPRPVSLRSVVERCSGLFSGLAGGRLIEVCYGEAASVPVAVAEDAVERILVNLVGNAATALSEQRPSGAAAIAEAGRYAAADGAPGGSRAGGPGLASDAKNFVRETYGDTTEDDTPGAIRIGVGVLVNRVGDPRPWPFRRVRLVVEDSGCGMFREQLERLLCGTGEPSRSNHGIGFRVVRELVAASHGDLRVMSAPGIGTRVQIEWPMAGLSEPAPEERARPPRMPGRVVQSLRARGVPMASGGIHPAVGDVRPSGRQTSANGAGRWV